MLTQESYWDVQLGEEVFEGGGEWLRLKFERQEYFLTKLRGCAAARVGGD
jgi:hypothetical protein